MSWAVCDNGQSGFALEDWFHRSPYASVEAKPALILCSTCTIFEGFALEDRLRLGHANSNKFGLHCARLALSLTVAEDRLRLGNANSNKFGLHCARLALSLCLRNGGLCPGIYFKTCESRESTYRKMWNASFRPCIRLTMRLIWWEAACVIV